MDIDVLLQILSEALNVKEVALSWFSSFLKNRSQCVKIENSFSNTLESKYGVAPGSTLGPIFFNVYSMGLFEVVTKTGFKTSSYADDSNGRLQFAINMQHSSLCVEIPKLLSNLKTYMNNHFLKMNTEKTEIIVLYPKHFSGKLISGIFLNRSCVRFTNECRYLGFYMDSNMLFDKQVNDIISSCTLKIRRLRRIRHLMNNQDAETFVKTVIFSKINYCNILFLNISCKNLDKLQKLQNTAVRLIFNLPPRSSISEKYAELKLLNVSQYIVFKCLLFVQKFFRNEVPEGIKNLLSIQNETNRLLEVKYFGTQYARKSFTYCAPRYWNKLNFEIKFTENTGAFKSLAKNALLENENNILSATTGYYFLPRY